MSPPKANLIDKLTRFMTPDSHALLQDVVQAASRLGLRCYLVGGPVRDLILAQPFTNADVAIEGDAIAVAEAFAGRRGLRLVKHPRFRTATIEKARCVLDLVTARSESYECPGALPDITPGTIEDDLRRRDFTINAIALALNGPQRDEIIDPLNGREDLARRLVRVLHPRSFQDDATRILRAARYEARLRFTIEPETEALLRRDISYLHTISPERIHHELVRTFEEDEPEHALQRLDSFGVLAAIHPALAVTAARVEAFQRLRSIGRRHLPSAYWPLLAWDARRGDVAPIAERIALRRPQLNAVAAVPDARDIERPLSRPDIRNSRIVELLSPFPLATLWALAAVTAGDTVRDRVLRYLRRLRRVRPELTGDDLIAMGVPRGPIVGELLRRLRSARLDGRAATRRDEEALARELVADLA